MKSYIVPLYPTCAEETTKLRSPRLHQSCSNMNPARLPERGLSDANADRNRSRAYRSYNDSTASVCFVPRYAFFKPAKPGTKASGSVYRCAKSVLRSDRASVLITFCDAWRLIASRSRQSSCAFTRSRSSTTRRDSQGEYKPRTPVRRVPSVVEVEFVLLGDRIPVLVPFLEDRVEQGAHDLAELLNFRAKTRQFSHELFVRRRHQNLVALLSRGRFLSFCLRFLMLILGTQSSGILPRISDADRDPDPFRRLVDFDRRGPDRRRPDRGADHGRLPARHDLAHRGRRPRRDLRGVFRESSPRRVRSRERRDEGPRSLLRAFSVRSFRRGDSIGHDPGVRAAHDRRSKRPSRHPSLTRPSSTGPMA